MEALRTMIEGSALEKGFVELCQRTGMRWGPNGQENLFWYRPPWLHVVEFVVFHTFVYALRRQCKSYFRDAVERPPPREKPSSRLDQVLGLLYLACWVFQITLKALRPQPLIQLCWMLMPCHLITLVWVYVLLSPPRLANMNLLVYLASLCSAYHWGPTSAAAVPDWGDHQFVIEGYFFVLHHGLLLLTPVYFAARYGLLPFTWQFLAHATWVATLINVGPYTVLSYLSGLNINYHLYPPPRLMTQPVFATIYYRFIVVGLLVVATVVCYFCIDGAGYVLRGITRRLWRLKQE